MWKDTSISLMQFFFLAAHRGVGGWEWVKRVLSIKTGANPIKLILHNVAILA
jgi:hypothetical protein